MKINLKLIILMLLPLALQAQTSLSLPVDPGVRCGKLDNGLTYYIRHNAYPEKRADFYIAQNVGSVLEEDSQAGLAHFLEHMAFNGTKHYPGRKNMLNYLEKNGAKFGNNVNAYTSFDETVYNLSDIPVTREGLVDSCLLILHDWSSFITLDNTEIDKERAIIREEWRTRNNANFRTMEQLFPILFKGSRYANRMPIGSMEVVGHSPYQEIKNYYHKWYRPDLQSIIIVGDIDVDRVENRIKEMFADIKKPVNPAVREYFSVPDYKEPIVSVLTDPETTTTSLTVYYPHDITSKEIRGTEKGYTQMILDNFVSGMLSNRLSEISQKADAPFMNPSARNGNFFVAKTKAAWTLSATCKDNGVAQALHDLVAENERVKEFGFTQPELDRVKSTVFEMYTNSYNNRNKQSNDSYVREYIGNFTDNDPIPGIEFEYKLVNKLLSTIDLNIVNDYFRQISATPNMVISVVGPQKKDLVFPSDKELLDVVQSVATEKRTGYEEKSVSTQLINHVIVPGKVVKTTKDTKLDATEWILSNGMRIVLKKTNFKDDQILMSSMALGGKSLFPDKDVYNANVIQNIPTIGGMGSFSSIDLSKALAGKSVDISVNVNSSTEGISGTSSIKDLETLLQLTHLFFTEPRKDDQAYSAFIENLGSSLKNAEASPTTALKDSLTRTIYGDNPRMKRMHYADISALDYDRIIQMYKTVFANPSTFTFTFVGSVDQDSLRPLVEKYLGSLPAGNKNIKNRKIDERFRKGIHRNFFSQNMQIPKTTSVKVYLGDLKRTRKNEMTIAILKQILDIVYVRTVREAEGGTYSVSVGSTINRVPSGRALLQIAFDTDPDKERKLSEIVYRELDHMATVGPDSLDFNKVKEYMEKGYQEQIKTNAFWEGVLSFNYFYKEDRYTDYLNILRSITLDDIKKITKELISQKNLTEVVIMPK